MKIDAEDFEAWKSHPITEAFLKACGVWAENARELWMRASWEAGVNNDTNLWRLKGQAESLREMQDVTAENIEEALNGSEERRAESA